MIRQYLHTIFPSQWCLNAWTQVSNDMIIKSFVICNLGPKRDDNRLHPKLNHYVTQLPFTDSVDESLGLTDTESDVEETEEQIVNAFELIVVLK